MNWMNWMNWIQRWKVKLKAWFESERKAAKQETKGAKGVSDSHEISKICLHQISQGFFIRWLICDENAWGKGRREKPRGKAKQNRERNGILVLIRLLTRRITGKKDLRTSNTLHGKLCGLASANRTQTWFLNTQQTLRHFVTSRDVLEVFICFCWLL